MNCLYLYKRDFYFLCLLFPGAPSVEVLDSPVTAMDHPFLRAMQMPSTSSPQTSSPLADGNEVTKSTVFGVVTV